MFDAILLVVFPLLAAYGGASDLFSMTIPNRVSILMVAGFVAVAAFTGMPAEAWGLHLAAFAIIFLAGFSMFAFGWMGGGDAKFLSAIALWIGLGPALSAFILLVCVYGLVLTLGIVMARGWYAFPEALARQEWFARLYNPNTGIPYGIAIAAAALHIYPSTGWFALIGS